MHRYVDRIIEMTTSRLNVDSIDSDMNGMKNGGEHLGQTGTDLELESWCSQESWFCFTPVWIIYKTRESLGDGK